jgi:hypothetical protein
MHRGAKESASWYENLSDPSRNLSDPIGILRFKRKKGFCGVPPRRLALKPARTPTREQKPASGTSAQGEAMYARAHRRAPLGGFLAFLLDF